MNFIKRLIHKRKLRKEYEKRMEGCWHNGGNSDERLPMGLDAAYLSPNFTDHCYTMQIAKK